MSIHINFASQKYPHSQQIHSTEYSWCRNNIHVNVDYSKDMNWEPIIADIEKEVKAKPKKLHILKIKTHGNAYAEAEKTMQELNKQISLRDNGLIAEQYYQKNGFLWMRLIKGSTV